MTVLWVITSLPVLLLAVSVFLFCFHRWEQRQPDDEFNEYRRALARVTLR